MQDRSPRVIDLAIVRAVTLALLGISAVAHAAPSETVVVVSSDTGFTRAVDAAFRAAGIRAVAVADVIAPAIADLTNASRALADREHATAAVVLVFGADGATLIAYDRSVDRALVRVLRVRAPLGPRESAEAAHMARTMLRAVRVTPDLDLPLPPPQEAIAIRARTAQAELAPPAPGGHGPEAGALALALGGGLRVGAPGAATRASGDVQLIWRPDAIGLAVTASLAGSSSIDTGSFTGTVSDTAGAVTARSPIDVAPRWRLIGDLGVAVHRIRIAGASATGPVDIVRLDPALRIGGGAVFVASASVSVGVTAWADALLVRQDYRVVSEQILDVPVAQVTLAVTLVARIL